MNAKFWMLFLALLLAAGGGYFLLRSTGGAPDGGQSQQGSGLPVVAYTVTPQPLHADITSVGTLEAGEAATLRAEVPGMVAAIYFTEGANVKQGDLLLEIDNRTYQQEYNQAKASYELARLTEQRRRKLLKNDFVSAQAADEAVAGLSQTSAAMQAAKVRLEKTRITAPFDGVVGMRTLSVGDFLNVGDAVTEVVALDPMKVQVAVPERYFSRVKDGLPVTLSVDAWPGQSFAGVLYAIDPNVDAGTRNVTIKAMVRNKGQALRPGMFARVSLSLGITDNAILIPEEAVIPKGDAASVMKVEEGKAAPADVALGLRRDGKVEVLSGLAAGDVVITAGQMKVGPGMPVTVIPADTAPAAGDATQASDKESDKVTGKE